MKIMDLATSLYRRGRDQIHYGVNRFSRPVSKITYDNWAQIMLELLGSKINPHHYDINYVIAPALTLLGDWTTDAFRLLCSRGPANRISR
jgi:hypothetical protein